MKTVEGVMVMKNGKAWGETYADGQITEYGWMAPEDAPIHDPQYCKKPTDVTWKGSPYTKELSSGKLVLVRKITVVEIFDESR